MHDKKNKISVLSNCRYCADRSQNLPGPAPTFGSIFQTSSKFYPIRFTFGGVIAERVNTVLLPRRVGLFPIFARSEVSLRANNDKAYDKSVTSKT